MSIHRRRLLADITPLRESPEFRRVWLGSLVSGTGGMITSVAVPIQIYALTRSSLAVGLLGLFLSVPLITVSLVGSSFVDAVDRRALILLTSTLLSGISLLLALQAFFHLRLVWVLYVLIAVQSSLVAIDSPARRTIIPRLLPTERIAAANALSFLAFQVSVIVGPLLAGVMIAAWGVQFAYLVDAASFLFSIYAVARLHPMRAAADAARPGVQAVLEGLRFVRRHPVIRTVLLIDLNATIFGFPRALFPALADTHFGGGARTVGVLYAALAVGGLASALFSGSLSHLRRQGLAVTVAIAIWGAAMACFALVPWLPLACLCLAIAGGGDVVNHVFRTTILQTQTPDALQGRVSSVGFVVGAGGPQVGDVEAGVVAQLTSPVFSAFIGGAICVAGVVLLTLAVPSFARYRAQSEPAVS